MQFAFFAILFFSILPTKQNKHTAGNIWKAANPANPLRVQKGKAVAIAVGWIVNYSVSHPQFSHFPSPHVCCFPTRVKCSQTFETQNGKTLHFQAPAKWVIYVWPSCDSIPPTCAILVTVTMSRTELGLGWIGWGMGDGVALAYQLIHTN